MKKWISLTAASLMLMCCLTGCGNNDKDKASKDTTESSSEAVTSDREEPSTENEPIDSTEDGVIDEIVTDAGDMVEDIVTDAGDVIDDIIPEESSSSSVVTTK